MTVKSMIDLAVKSFQYNLKIIFADRFKYFLLAGVGLFLLIAILSLFDAGSNPNTAIIFYWLMFPGLLMIFYPTVFGIQNDVDSRTLEVLFGIPNYRYKVWLVRLVVIYLVVFMLLLVLAALCAFAFLPFNVFDMVFQLMYPVFFIGSLAFMLSTLVRNGYGTAVIMVVIGLIFWILAGVLEESKWNIFLNPFHIPQDVSDLVWLDMLFKNRLYLIVGIVLSLLFGLLNLQKRERFV